MTTPFLKIVAKDLYAKFGEQLRNVTILFPNKRAGLFFNQYLFEITNQPTWAPQYLTISDLFQQLSPLTVADPIQLICMLYKSYTLSSNQLAQAVYGDNSHDSIETLDQFYSWGQVLLADYQYIDNNLVDARKLFENISDLNDLTSLDYLTQEQIDAIKHFFPDFTQPTELQRRFFNVWKLLLPTYEAFRSSLTSNRIAYESMLKRNVVNRLQAYSSQNSLPAEELFGDDVLEQTASDFIQRFVDNLSSRTFVMIGFNVLSKSEQLFFKYLKQNANALFYWDYDDFYKTDDAFHFIEENILLFGNELAEPLVYSNFLEPKNITFTSVPQEIMQTRVAHDILMQWKAPEKTDNRTAVVMCNEAMLAPMLHSLPEGQMVNITMGYPLAHTPIANFLTQLVLLQTKGSASSSSWRYTYVCNVLKHPYAALITDDESLHVLDLIKKKHQLFPSDKTLHTNNQMAAIFTRNSSTADLLAYLSNIIEMVGKAFTPVTASDNDESNENEELQLIHESVFRVYAVINRLCRICEEGLLDIQIPTLQRMMQQIIQGTSIPFHGEPAVGMQIMGILETRNIDFRNLIILSANEGNLPKNPQSSSFIPYNLREAFGMTTLEHKGSMYAYYFYRLLQRAENIHVLYTLPGASSTGTEMSRYLMQMLVNPKLRNIRQTTVHATYSPRSIAPVAINKTDETIRRLFMRFGEKPLSPSAINTYLNCQLQFYFKYAAGFFPEEDVTEEVGNDVFGNIFHYVMEQIYKSAIGLNREIQASTLVSLAKDKQFVSKLVDQAFNKLFFKNDSASETVPQYNGEQLLNREVVITYICDQLRHDAALCPLSVIDVEEKVGTKLVVPGSGGRTIVLGGTIDRIDCITINGRRVKRIVDYKTSASRKTANTVEELFDSAKSNRSGHIFQTFCYADIYTDVHPEVKPLAPALQYVKLVRSDLNAVAKSAASQEEKASLPLSTLMVHLKDGKEEYPVDDFAEQVKEEYHERLISCISDIFDKNTPFAPPSSNHHCQWCPFTAICNK